jgi:hypothetical protein
MLIIKKAHPLRYIFYVIISTHLDLFIEIIFDSIYIVNVKTDVITFVNGRQNRALLIRKIIRPKEQPPRKLSGKKDRNILTLERD